MHVSVSMMACSEKKYIYTEDERWESDSSIQAEVSLTVFNAWAEDQGDLKHKTDRWCKWSEDVPRRKDMCV